MADNLVQICPDYIHLNTDIFCCHQGMSYQIYILCNRLSCYIRHKAQHKAYTFRFLDNNLNYILCNFHWHSYCSFNRVDYKANNLTLNYQVNTHWGISIFLRNQGMSYLICILCIQWHYCTQRIIRHKAYIIRWCPCKIQYYISCTCYFRSCCN